MRDGGACNLGNVNLTLFVVEPFKACKTLDDVLDNFYGENWVSAIGTGVRFLDNVLDATEYPYQKNQDIAIEDRRIGLNPWSGIGSFLAMNQVPYDSPLAVEVCDFLGKVGALTAYAASVELSAEKGFFTNLGEAGSADRTAYVNSPFIQKLESLSIQFIGNSLVDSIQKFGIRNCACLTVPPVGTGSLLMNNISNGIEPIFALEYNRKVKQSDGSLKTEAVEDYAWGLWKKDRQSDMSGNYIGLIPDYFKCSRQIDPKAHIDVMCAIQEWCDGNISKTVNIPESYTLEEYKDLMMYAIKSGVHGFTSFREGTREGVLSEKHEAKVDELATKAMEVQTTRPRVLDGKTYQIKEEGNHRTYCTINHIVDNGVKKPWEIFLFSSSRHAEYYAAIGRLASRLMRKTGDVQGVIEELMEIGGDNGYLTPEYGYLTSKPQHFAKVLEEYVKGLNFDPDAIIEQELSKCPQCGEMTLVHEGGCNHCESCLYSECG